MVLALCIGAPCCFFYAAAYADLLWEEREPAYFVKASDPMDQLCYWSAINSSAYFGMSDRVIPIWASWWSLMLESVEIIRAN